MTKKEINELFSAMGREDAKRVLCDYIQFATGVRPMPDTPVWELNGKALAIANDFTEWRLSVGVMQKQEPDEIEDAVVVAKPEPDPKNETVIAAAPTLASCDSVPKPVKVELPEDDESEVVGETYERARLIESLLKSGEDKQVRKDVAVLRNAIEHLSGAVTDTSALIQKTLAYNDESAKVVKELVGKVEALESRPVPKATVEVDAETRNKIVADTEKVAADFLKRSVVDLLKDGKIAEPGAAVVAAASSVETNNLMPTAGGVDMFDKCRAADAWDPDVGKIPVAILEATHKVRNFLSEFSLFRDGANARVINTMMRLKNGKDITDYILNYAELAAMEDANDLKEKVKSPEWKEVCDACEDASPFVKGAVNKRFAVFYGVPGGGKTYAAIQAANEINGGDSAVFPASTLVVNPAMDAGEILYCYWQDYATGRKGYKPTGVLSAMITGRAVVIDEINTASMEVRMFLQSILDGKERVEVCGNIIQIHPKFCVIGTMNLETGLGLQPLPPALVDRAAVIKKFKMTDEQAAAAAVGVA